MKSYEDLQQFLADVQQRKMDLNDQKNALIGQRGKLQEAWEDAVFAGEGVREAKQAMKDLESQIDDLNDHIRILESRTRTSSKVIELAEAVHADCKHTLAGMKNNYNSQSDKVLKLKNDYLRELAILGEINNIASRYSFFASEASIYIPGDRVHVGLNADRFKEVALDTHEVRETYKNGRTNKQ